MIGRTASMILVAAFAASAAMAQVRTVDPNSAGSMAATHPVEEHGQATPVPPAEDETPPAPARTAEPAQPEGTKRLPPASPSEIAARESAKGGTYEEGDVIGAAEGVICKDAAGLAALTKKIFKEQSSPNA